jgi:hypothetical protein
VRIFSLASFAGVAFLTLPRAKPHDIAAERRSISAFRNALAINVNSQACDGVAFANRENFVHLIFDRISDRESACATGRSF